MHTINASYICKRPLEKEKNTTARAKSFRNATIVAWGAGLPTDATLGVSFFVWRLRRHNYIASFGRVATFFEAAWMPVSTRTMC